ncbi:H-NS family nucleoid-associated regulatory protein [Xenorhabdus entomophaga]|uniref:H-NS histone family protein n=1 Tax=Xenorhabdus entomophaga TaxID=3136257 RepID=UPI0030F3F1FD
MKELTKDEEYQITSNHLSGLTSLRRFAQTKDFEWLEDVCNKLKGIVEEKREAFELAKLEAEERENKRQKAIKLIEEMGFSIESLSEPVTAETRKIRKSKKNKAPKYRFTDPTTGEIDTWSGIGRMKKGLQSLINDGHSLDQYLIDDKNENNQ